ncbi:hypothetical protein J6590_032512 [Homalodisca vitripennis]|nr:hypothetical protein J6590_032512 [Homalodisca vitripennis]
MRMCNASLVEGLLQRCCKRIISVLIDWYDVDMDTLTWYILDTIVKLLVIMSKPMLLWLGDVVSDVFIDFCGPLWAAVHTSPRCQTPRPPLVEPLTLFLEGDHRISISIVHSAGIYRFFFRKSDLLIDLTLFWPIKEIFFSVLGITYSCPRRVHHPISAVMHLLQYVLAENGIISTLQADHEPAFLFPFASSLKHLRMNTVSFSAAQPKLLGLTVGTGLAVSCPRAQSSPYPRPPVGEHFDAIQVK